MRRVAPRSLHDGRGRLALLVIGVHQDGTPSFSVLKPRRPPGVMLNPLSSMHATRAAVAQAISILRVALPSA